MKFIFILFLSLFSFQVFGQDLMAQRIRKLTGNKKSVYFDSGIFHNGSPKGKSVLKKIRHSYVKKNGYERIVFDFTTQKLPRVYGHISGKNKRLYLDLFKTEISKNIGSFGNSKYVESINFFPIDEKSLSVELIYKNKANVEIFYLNSPARLVVDIRS